MNAPVAVPGVFRRLPAWSAPAGARGLGREADS